MSKMSENTKIEVALEILANKIAKTSNQGYASNSEEMLKLLSERQKLYAGDREILDKIIDNYGPEIKKDYNMGERNNGE